MLDFKMKRVLVLICGFVAFCFFYFGTGAKPSLAESTPSSCYKGGKIYAFNPEIGTFNGSIHAISGAWVLLKFNDGEGGTYDAWRNLNLYHEVQCW